MADNNALQWTLHGWHGLICLPVKERLRLGFSAPQGQISDNHSIDMFLRGILLFGPSAFLLTIGSFRIYQLHRARLVTKSNGRGLLKISVAALLFALQLINTVTTIPQAPRTTVTSQLLSLVSYTALSVLSFLEHGRSITPSTILTIYLVFSTTTDIIHLGLLYAARTVCNTTYAALAILAAKIALLVLEAQNKTSILREPYQQLAPEERAGVLSTTFFWWVNSFITQGYSRVLSLDDMPLLPSYLDTLKMREAMQRAWDGRKSPIHRYTLVLTQFRLFLRPNLGVVLPRFLFTVFRYGQPLLIARAIAYVSKDLPAFESRNEAFQLILLTFIIYMGMAVFKAMYDIRLHRISVMSKMTMIGLIHNRCLTIKYGAFDDAAAVTLISTDVEEVMFSADIFHEIWAQCLELCIGLYFLARELGWVCIVPLLVVACIPTRQKALNMATQDRISRIKAVLESMKNIKMMGLVNIMEGKVQAVRDYEIKMLVDLHWLYVGFQASASMLSIFSPAMTLIIYAIQAEWRGTKSVDVNLAFTSLAIVTMVTGPANNVLTRMAHAASALAAFDRIQKYVSSPDRHDERQIMDKKRTDGPGGHGNGKSAVEFAEATRAPIVSIQSSDVDDLVVVVVGDVTIRPAPSANPVLRNLKMDIKEGSLNICSGAVGTGKTTLIKALLGELPSDSGTIQTSDRLIAYCSQTAWLPNGTIKDIVRGPLATDNETDEAWYGRVLKACDLDEDLHQLLDGDQTVIGSRGIMLSGGQKQRVALARAVYARYPIVVLDDVLSALDATTESHIVNDLLGPGGLFKELGTTVLLITHSTQHLPLADQIIILGEDGRTAEQGTWDDLRAKTGYISQVVLKEKSGDIKISSDKAGKRERIQVPKAKHDDVVQDMTRKTGDITLYGYYFSSIGSYRLLLFLSSLTAYAVFLALTPIWLRRWAEGGSQDTIYYTSIYILTTLGAFVSVVMTIATIFLLIAPKSSNNLHAQLLRTVMAAPQSYFATTETGITLNRFTADTSMIDRNLAIFLWQVGQCLFTLLSQAILLCIAEPLMALTLPFTFSAVYLIQKFYLATSRQLRFLDLETKAAITSSFLETLEGVATIRAFSWQRPIIEDNIKKLELSLRPWYLMMCLQRWLNVTMDLVVLGLAMVVICLAVTLKDRITGGQIGIALNVVLQANMSLLRLVEAWTILETSLGAVSRLRAFEKTVLPEDKPGEVHQPPETWPAEGAVTFDSLSVAYKPGVLALKDVNISIGPGTKVGVCGRTGSGKSSSLLSILRLVEIETGTIYIDGLNLQTLSRNSIRSRIITVPQDPMLVLTDTIRQNLDITDAGISDEDITNVLEKVGLWSILQARAGNAEIMRTQAQDLATSMGAQNTSPLATTPTLLNLPLHSLPLSHGQTQLFSLARALLMRLYRGKLVLLDEATSNVDEATDRLMQKLIGEEFVGYTVVSVAHRGESLGVGGVRVWLEGGRVGSVEEQ